MAKRWTGAGWRLAGLLIRLVLRASLSFPLMFLFDIDTDRLRRCIAPSRENRDLPRE
jgi:hypothetical protein